MFEYVLCVCVLCVCVRVRMFVCKVCSKMFCEGKFSVSAFFSSLLYVHSNVN